VIPDMKKVGVMISRRDFYVLVRSENTYKFLNTLNFQVHCVCDEHLKILDKIKEFLIGITFANY